MFLQSIKQKNGGLSMVVSVAGVVYATKDNYDAQERLTEELGALETAIGKAFPFMQYFDLLSMDIASKEVSMAKLTLQSTIEMRGVKKVTVDWAIQPFIFERQEKEDGEGINDLIDAWHNLSEAAEKVWNNIATSKQISLFDGGAFQPKELVQPTGMQYKLTSHE